VIRRIRELAGKMVNKSLSCDVLVIGGGAAGCFAAIKARECGADVIIVSKGVFGRDGASTWMAGPAIQAALYPPDSPEVHAHDVVRIGRFLADQDLVSAYTRRLPDIIRELDLWGFRFKKIDGTYEMARYPGETHARVVNPAAVGSFNGPQYRRVLPARVRQLGVRIIDDLFMSDLLAAQGEVTGAVGLDIRGGEPVMIRAKSVVLGTGGHMGCYSRTVTPTSTGDGNAMAFRAGVELADMEFTDFYAYVTVWPPGSRDEEWPAQLVYELGARMYNRNGEEFMRRYTGAKRVPPRALAIELRTGNGSSHGGAYLSLRHLPVNLVDDYLTRVGNQRWVHSLREIGFDPHDYGVEIAPAAITSFGGCKVNQYCETSLLGLFAAGEVASGHQGAYVMVGNMVGTSAAMGCIAGEQAAKRAKGASFRPNDPAAVRKAMERILAPVSLDSGCSPLEVKAQVQKVLDNHAYVVGRTEAGMTQGLSEIESIEREMVPKLVAAGGSKRFSLSWLHALEAANQTQIAKLILLSARARTESRGSHYRDDFPEENPEWVQRVVLRQSGDRVTVRKDAVAFTHVKPRAKTD